MARVSIQRQLQVVGKLSVKESEMELKAGNVMDGWMVRSLPSNIHAILCIANKYGNVLGTRGVEDPMEPSFPFLHQHHFNVM